MTQKGEISKAERRSLAVASATLGPWRSAAVVGALGGGVAFAAGAIGDGGGFGTGVLAGSLSVALMLFFLVGGAGAARGGRQGAPADRRIRRWATAHPWRVAAVPAALLVVTDLVARQVLLAEGFFGSMWDGLWRGALVLGAVGLVGKMSRTKR
ncbi:hypothetical protein ABCR94_31590 [Streptomyces sp. 21So2-11]|uniref:hypothetical protein n=1 Tax=Streptomyces sp. 21So2-11 TaxID=3144408 RepID=UPI00321BCC00